MKQLFTVLKFEYLNFLKNKIFIISTVVLALITAIVTFAPRFTDSLSFSDSADTVNQTLLVVDNSGVEGTGLILQKSLTDCDIVLDTSADEKNAEDYVTSGDYDAAVIITGPLEYTYIVNNKLLYDTTTYTIDEVLTANYKNRYLLNAGITEEQLYELSDVAVTSNSVIVGQDQTQNFILAYVLMMMLYISVMIYGQLVAQNVAVEKSSRAMELLITSASPKSLIFGKVLGTGLAGLSQIAALLGWGLICLSVNKSYLFRNEIFASFVDIPVSMILYTLVFFILGFLIYAFLMGAMGSMASKLEEVGTLTMPAMMTFVIGFIATISFMSSGNIDNPVMKVLSYIPFTSPMAMLARITMGEATGLQAAVSIVILLLSIIGVGYVAVAIYKIGILMYGKPPKFNEILKALQSGRKK